MEKKEEEANKILHRAALTEIDVCDDLIGLIYDSNCTDIQKMKLLSKASQLRSIISSLTMRLDWQEDAD